ncbi:hypothetical protein THAOC_04260, partial [Thalassiosira oceanica]
MKAAESQQGNRPTPTPISRLDLLTIRCSNISASDDRRSTMSATEAAAATPVVEKSDNHADAHDVKLTPLLAFKYVASLGLMVFSMVLVGALIFTKNTRVAQEASPWVSLIVLILAVLWLTMIEGQQASLVGLPPVDPDLYKDSHPMTYKNAAIAFKGDNLDRYLMGRQFMVLLVV